MPDKKKNQVKKNGKARVKTNKSAKKPAILRWPALSLTKGAWIYLAVWLVGLLSTQTLRSSASNLFFTFVILLPVASLIYALIGKSAIRVYMLADNATAEKLQPMTYEFRIFNESILPYPFVDAYLMLPSADSVKCRERRVRMSVPPSSDYNVKNTVKFRFRGTYEIGVSCFYVYDYFRIFRVKIPEECYETVYVLPRKLVMNSDSQPSASDSAQRTRRSEHSYEKIEVSDIRDYRIGDPIKSIHWKLSSKSENLIIREYNSGSTEMSFVFADMSARFPDTPPLHPFVFDPYAVDAKPAADKAPEEEKQEPVTAADSAAAGQPEAPDAEQEAPAPEKSGKASKKKRRAKKETAPAVLDVGELIDDAAYEDMNEYCADGVVELAVASVLRELRAGRRVTLMWFDKRSEIGAFSFEVRSENEFESVFRLFATAPLAPAEKTVAKLSAMVNDSEDAKYIFVLPTIDDETVTSICTMPCTSDSSSSDENEVVLYTAEERYAHKAERNAYIEGCRVQLAENGLTLVKGTLDGFSEAPSDNKGEEATGDE